MGRRRERAYGERVRWEQLFADLEAQLAGAGAERGLVADLERAEVARTPLADRIRAHAGAEVRLRLRDGSALAGIVVEAAPAWLLLREGAQDVLVPAAALAGVSGLSRAVAPPAGQVARRLGLGEALRALARDRTPVRLLLDGGAVTGTVDRVGADHLDLAEHPVEELRRAAAVRGVLAVPFAVVLAVRSTAAAGEPR
jgi:hypothetical protein